MTQFSKNIEASLRYIYFYGVFEGLKISFYFFFNRIDRIRLKGIKYPIRLRRGTSDINTFHQIFALREYAIKQLPGEAMTIIDGGANVGLFSVFMKNKYPNSQVVAVEPDDGNFDLMVENLKDYIGIIPLKAGLWTKSSLLKTEEEGRGKWGIIVHGVNNPEESNVRGVSILEIMEKNNFERIDILKLDIEGSEKVLFEENYGIWLPKVKILIIEFHDWINSGTAQPAIKAINECFPRFSFYVKGENVVFVNEEL